jgi:hypothetical protein
MSFPSKNPYPNLNKLLTMPCRAVNFPALGLKKNQEGYQGGKE